MRARNIKTGFFSNEELAEASIYERMLFIGLWCMADREGRLEDNPKRIKFQLFPMDENYASIDVDRGLSELAKRGFIQRYAINGMVIIHVVHFTKHQSPHHTEKDSVLPDPEGFYTVTYKSKDERGKTITCKKRVTSLSNTDYSVPHHNDDLENNGDLTVKPPESPPLEEDDSPLIHGDATEGSPLHSPLNPDCLNPESGILKEKAMVTKMSPTPAKSEQIKQTITNHTSKQRNGVSDAGVNGSRLYDDWVLSENGYQFALSRDLAHEAILDEVVKFKNYWTAKTGKGATKLDWDKTWQNWILGMYQNPKPKSSATTAPSAAYIAQEAEKVRQYLEGGCP